MKGQTVKVSMVERFIQLASALKWMGFSCLILMIPCSIICSQATTGGSADPQQAGFEVQWISQFPVGGEAQKPSFGERISNLVFGQRPSEIVKPFNVVAKDPEEYWILDQGTGRVVKITHGEARPLKATGKEMKDFPSLVGMCLMPGGDLLLTDSRTNQVFRIAGGTWAPFAETVSFRQPTGIAFSGATGEIWVVETAAHIVTVLNMEGEVVRRIGGRGTGQGSFNYPTFIWIDAEGRVYIVDSMNFRVQILDELGNFLGAFGENGDATGTMARPKGVAIDSHGNIYVVDALFHAVQIFNREGHFLYSFGTQGQQKGEFWMPTGIFIDATDNIYVTDSYNSRVQVFQLVKKSST